MDKSKASKLGAGNKSMKKFPTIMDYLEVYHKDIYDLINDLGMQGALSPRRGGSITFLKPDSNYLKKLIALSKSDTPEIATDIVSSLILVDLFTSPQEFADKQDDIPTLLGKKLVIKGISKDKVSIDSGELALDVKFKPFERSGKAKRGNVAVWDLKGEVGYEKAPETAYKYGRSVAIKSKVKGSSESDDQLYLNKIVKDIEEGEVLNLGKNIRSSDGKIASPMLNAVAKVLRYFEQNNEMYNEYKKARCIMTQNHVIDFYLLFRNPHMFSARVLIKAFNSGYGDKNAEFIKSFHSNFNHPSFADERDVLIFSEQGISQINAEKNNIRLKLMDRTDKTIGNKIVRLYEEIDESNKLGRLGPVYPKCVIECFQRHKNLHLTFDEFSYVMYRALKVAKSMPSQQAKASELNEIIKMFYDCYGNFSTAKTLINKPDFIGVELDTNSVIYGYVMDFWKMFGLHMPYQPDGDLEQAYVGAYEDSDPFAKDLINVDEEIFNDLDNYDNSELALSSNTIAEMQAYMKANNGEIPAELMKLSR